MTIPTPPYLCRHCREGDHGQHVDYCPESDGDCQCHYGVLDEDMMEQLWTVLDAAKGNMTHHNYGNAEEWIDKAITLYSQIKGER